jgi:hypothetical protein
MKNLRTVDSCLNCKHCETVDHWDWTEHNCIKDSEPRPHISEEITAQEYEANREWRAKYGVDACWICDDWEEMQ